VAIAAMVLRRRWPAFAAAAAAYAVVLSPILGLHQSGPQLVADRYSYVANIAWTILVGGLIARWLPRSAPAGRAVAVTVGLVLAGALGVLTWRQTMLWRDTERLFAHAAAVAPGAITHLNYGRELAARDQTEAAAAQFQGAVSINPRYGEAWFALGNALNKLNQLPEAEQAYLKARSLMADSWRPNVMLGVMYISRMDRAREAAECFRAAVANVEAPGARSFSARPYLMLAAALDELGDQKGAREMLEKAARYPETRDEAVEHLRELDTPPSPG
jgi:tetratricopeptide (TPR) repeat protein